MKLINYTLLILVMSVNYSCTKEENSRKVKQVEHKQLSENKNNKVNDLTYNNQKVENSNPINKYDCYSCHADKEKIVGPSFKTIAENNAGKNNAEEYLENKIKNGSLGVYGEIPMQPHQFISENEIKQICQYILNLKNDNHE